MSFPVVKYLRIQGEMQMADSEGQQPANTKFSLLAPISLSVKKFH